MYKSYKIKNSPWIQLQCILLHIGVLNIVVRTSKLVSTTFDIKIDTNSRLTKFWKCYILFSAIQYKSVKQFLHPKRLYHTVTKCDNSVYKQFLLRSLPFTWICLSTDFSRNIGCFLTCSILFSAKIYWVIMWFLISSAENFMNTDMMRAY